MIKKVLAAAIENPVLHEREGTYAEVEKNPLGFFLARLWSTVVVVGGLALLIFLIWGGVDWLTSEGDPEKLKNAKNKIIHAIFGMALLAASFAAIRILDAVFGIDLLNIQWPTPEV